MSPSAMARAMRARPAADSISATSPGFFMFPHSTSTFGTVERFSPARSLRDS